MNDDRNYFTALESDLPSQFRGKVRIKGLLRVIAHQLEEVRTFLAELNIDRTVDTAIGTQLDGIGDIVCLTRQEAIELSDTATAMDDETYRKWLKYKIAINTSNGTYTDLMSAIKMLIGENDVVYSETPVYPATAIFDVTTLEYQDVTAIALLRKIKAAGVKLSFEVFSSLEYFIYENASSYESVREERGYTFPLPEADYTISIGTTGFEEVRETQSYNL